MKNFIGYCLRYWTHVRPIEIKKDGFLEPDVWYDVSFSIRLNGKSKTGDMWFDEIKIARNKIETE